jgi:hypothetical protein
MKPLERIFFTACIHECNYHSYSGVRADDIITIFEKLGFSGKQLIYYLEKWVDRGFYSYGVNICLGFFVFDKLRGEYKVIYNKECQKRGAV